MTGHAAKASGCGSCAAPRRSSGSSSSRAWRTYYRSPDGEALRPHLRARARRGEVRRLLRGARVRAPREAPVRDRVQRLHGPAGRLRHARADGQHRPHRAVRPRGRLQPHRAHGRRPRRAAGRALEDRRRAREAPVRARWPCRDRADLLRPGSRRLPHRADRRRRVQDAPRRIGVPIARGFRGRRPADPDRLPPGQYETHDFPVLAVGPTPPHAADDWSFAISGAVSRRVAWTWDEILALPRETVTVDIHCVTQWSKFDTTWTGVSIDTLLGE